MKLSEAWKGLLDEYADYIATEAKYGEQLTTVMAKMKICQEK